MTWLKDSSTHLNKSEHDNSKSDKSALLYADRDIMLLDELGNFYSDHILAMTKEGLHSKSDIAAELGARDLRIKQLQVALQAYAKYATEAAMERDIRYLNDDV